MSCFKMNISLFQVAQSVYLLASVWAAWSSWSTGCTGLRYGPSTRTFLHPILHPISYKSDGDTILCPTRKMSDYTDASNSTSYSLSDSMTPCCPGGKCFPKFDASLKIKFVNNFGDWGRLVSDWKSDRESDGDPICMQIGRRIGCGIVHVDGPLLRIQWANSLIWFLLRTTIKFTLYMIIHFTVYFALRFVLKLVHQL
jgi:hypothetical protein